MVADEGWASSGPALLKNLSLLSPQQIEPSKMLLKEGQKHLFVDWSDADLDVEKQKAFFDQVVVLDSSYPGGLASYIENARQLLSDSKAGKNPYDGFTPSVPAGEVLTFGDENFMKLEKAGVKEARNSIFVIVASGLGERLGYKGIKLALPIETTTGKFFLQHYIESILALQEASAKFSQGILLNPSKSLFLFLETSFLYILQVSKTSVHSNHGSAIGLCNFSSSYCLQAYFLASRFYMPMNCNLFEQLMKLNLMN